MDASGPKYSPDSVVWVVMTHLADEGIKDEFTVPDADPVKARQAAADLLRALGVTPSDPQDPW
ncbi:hypothetical protein [Actinomadura sp. 9N215]|uniref:hypothetical protein n=1 Tax=Actinomadura sp. 9N215 TaxID=3375150 RepID=UPI0037BAD622